MPVTVKYQILLHNARVPTKATHESACYDLYSAETVDILNNTVHPVRTGLKLKPQYGYFIRIYARSGMAKNGIGLANGVGILDSDYSGECFVLLHNFSGSTYQVQVGHRIAQIEIAKIEDIRFVESNKIGGSHLGLGSTGK